MLNHMIHSRPTRLAAVLLMALSLTACKDSALQTAALSIRVAGVANDTLRSIVVSERDLGNIALPDATKILAVSDKVASAVIVAQHLTADYSTFPAGEKPTFHAVVAPLVAAVRDALDTGLTGIKNPALQQRLRVILQGIDAALAVADSALGVK